MTDNNTNNQELPMGCLMAIVIPFLIIFVLILNFLFIPKDNNKMQNTKTSNQISESEYKEAEDFIISLEAAGLIKDIKTQCADGTNGCYKILIDESLWDKSTSYDTKVSLVNASEIYTKAKRAKYYVGLGYYSNKKLYDSLGIKK